VLHLLPATASCTNLVQKNQFPRAKPPAHFDIFAIIFTVWSHILSTDGNALRGGCHDVGPLARSESQEVNQQILMMSFLRGGGAGSSSCVKCLLALI